MHPSLTEAFLTMATHSHVHILTLSDRIEEKHRVYGHGAVHEMGPSEGHAAMGQAVQGKLAHEHRAGTAATHIVDIVVA